MIPVGLGLNSVGLDLNSGKYENFCPAGFFTFRTIFEDILKLV